MQSHASKARDAVAALEAGDDEMYSGLLFELEQALGRSDAVREHLIEAGVALAYLRRADMSASEGDEESSKKFYERACCYVDENEALALAEEHRLSFVGKPQFALALTAEPGRFGSGFLG